jgi:hypothetical protein
MKLRMKAIRRTMMMVTWDDGESLLITTTDPQSTGL